MVYLGPFPVAPLIFALLIPIIYSLKNNKRELKPILLITLCSIGTIILYPITSFFSISMPLFGYLIGKIFLFVVFPIITIFYIEQWDLKDILSNVGVRNRNISKSIFYGLIVAIVTIIITVFVSSPSNFDPVYRTIMFFESFTEEFFFRGFLFLYLLKKTNPKIAYATSILGFILIHPQHFGNMFLISTVTQGVLLTIVTDKTKNIIGPWISHGLNRFIPALIRSLI